MTKAPSKIILAVFVVIALAVVVFLSSYSDNKLTYKTDEQLEQEAAAKKAADSASSASTPIPPPGVKPAIATGAPSSGKTDGPKLVALGQDATLGAASNSAPEVTVQWSWTPAVQNDPSLVYDPIITLTKSLPNARVHVVNTDEFEGMPSGVFVGGRQVAPARPDGSIDVNPGAIKGILEKK